jgi:hypothetical protein
MTVVGATALALGTTILWQRSCQYEALAAFHETEEQRWHEAALSHQEQADLIDQDRSGYEERRANGTATLTPTQYEEWLEFHASTARDLRASAAHHSRLKKVYRALARQPWKGPDRFAEK